MAGVVNRITANCVKGIYKDKEIEIELGDSWKNTKLKVDEIVILEIVKDKGFFKNKLSFPYRVALSLQSQ